MSRDYEPEPCYGIGPEVGSGYRAAVAGLAPGSVLAVDGSAGVDWATVVAGIRAALELPVKPLDLREHFAAWPDILASTESPVLADDPDFAPLSQSTLADFFTDLPVVDAIADAVTVVFGPGAALVGHDRLWYAELPKRYGEAALTSGTGRNLGQPAGAGPATTRRLFYIDWPILDRHRDDIVTEVDVWLDVQDPTAPAWLPGPALRVALAELAARPFRTRPTFNTTSWGGHWAQEQLGVNRGAANTALGYELIAPESGILLGDPDGPRVEVPLQVLVTQHPEQVLGTAVHDRFG
ncbi:MAG TPA: hypothetical protein VHZ97_21435, partial [Pseudonocardiaceae bacterium]|nr:hypothetical protein [Pseudonocardiaceae bacterium]